MHFTVRIFFAISLLLLAACQGVQFREDELPLEPSYARPAANEGPLADLAEHFTGRLGPEHSGFLLLDSSYDSLAWRLALIDSATTSLDIQTYLWYPDVAGRLILERAVIAARRGVHVRLVVDDLMTIGQENVLADLQRFGRVIDALPGDIGDVKQAIDAAQIDKGAVVGDVLDDAVQHLAFLPSLAALLPKPRVNLTRYHGVFAPNSKHRARVTPAKRGRGGRHATTADPEERTPAERRAAMTWARRFRFFLQSRCIFSSRYRAAHLVVLSYCG